MSAHKQQQNARIEEKDAVHDAKREARLQHRARLIHIGREGRVGRLPEVSERAQADVQRGGGEIGAAGVGDVAKLDHTRDESADEAHVDERDEDGRLARRSVAEESRDTPDQRQDGCYE
jgi:hypothetical protein